MFQTERVPVTVYRSTDEGAPQLSAAAGKPEDRFKSLPDQRLRHKTAAGLGNAV